jgi:hypothetical protein
MKKLLWLLLILNGLVAAVWLAGFSLPSKPVAGLVAPTQDAKRLQLLSELPRLPPRTGELEVATDTSSGLADARPSPDAGSAEPPSNSAAVTDAGLAESANAPAEPGTGNEVSPEAIVPAMSPAATTTTVPEPTNVPAAAPLCYRTGLLTSGKHEAVGAELRKAGVSDLKLSERGRAQPRYWVFWSGSLDEVEAVEQTLKSAVVRDWYRFRGTGGGAGISLGVFGQRGTAQQHQRNLAAKGVHAQIGERYAPQAQLRWTFSVEVAAVDTLKASMRRQGVSLEACP